MRQIASRSRALLLVLALIAPVASAESNGHVWFGGSIINGDATDQVSDGWSFGAGGIVNDSGGPMGWRWDVGYDRHDVPRGLFGPIQYDDGDVSTFFVRFGPQWDFEGYDSNFYIGVHAGYYWSYANISEYASVPGYICDPFWGWCYWATVPGEYILADRHDNDWGVSGTMGYEWDISGGTWFVEVQYHIAQHGEGYEFIPIAIGLRW